LSAPRLKVNGTTFNPHPPTPTQSKLISLLDKAPVDELYTPAELARRLGCSVCTFSDYMPRPGDPHAPYTAKVRHNRYWGNPKAIAELIRQVGA
jgi:hypothetical protein